MKLLRWLAWSFLAFFPGCSAPAPEPAAGRPNVVLILTDDQRWDTMSCVGHPFLRTPNMDRLAREGVRFANAFCTTSLCSPSRASILSGLYAHSHRVLNNFADFPAALTSYPRRLQESGYETAYIGKWHMGEEDDSPRTGFDYWMSHRGQGNYYDTTFNINGRRELLQGYITHRLTEKAIDWIRKPRTKPFCLILGHKAPHGPFVPEPKYAKTFDGADIQRPATAGDYGEPKPDWVRQRVTTWHGVDGPLYKGCGMSGYEEFVRAYYGTIQSVDDSVGQVYAALQESGKLDQTLLVYTTDNGYLLGEHGSIDKRAAWDESMRVPLLVRYPPLVPASRVRNEMVLHIDLAPTILEICGAKPLENIHGVSWVRLLRDDAKGWRTSFLYEYNYEIQFPYTPNVRGVRTDDWKFIRYPHGDGSPDRWKGELYDLKADPLETKNRIDDPAAAVKLQELRKEHERLKRETSDPDTMPVDEGIKQTLPTDAHRAVKRSGLDGETAFDPAPRKKDYPWMSLARWNQMHERFLKRAKEGRIDLLFLGDSITEGWGNNAVWQKHYGALNAANFGIGGDTTENVLWRIQNGELEGISPKVVVLLIGTNNFGLEGHAPDAVAKGIATIVQILRSKLPASKVLLLAIFPRDEKPGTDARNKIKKVNDQIATLDDQKSVRFLDIGPKLSNPDGSLSKEILPDFLHLSVKGYQIWAEAMDPLLRQLLGN